MAPVDRPELAREWAGALEQVIYIARAREEVESGLAKALDGIADAMCADPFDDMLVTAVAERLVDLGLTSPECVESSIKVLGAGMPKLSGVADLQGLPTRLVLVFSALAKGFAEAMRQRLSEEQEALTLALIRSRENAERALRDSEARFEEIFTASTVGMAITDLDFEVLRSNRALANILEYKGGKLGVTRLDDIFRADDLDYLRLRYQVLNEEGTPPFRERRSLRKSDGEEALVFLSASVLRDPGGTPQYYVTTVEDVSERHFLESQLRFQSITDALTGLPNRQRFEGRLEEALSGKNAAEELTILHLDLDGFHAVNDGIGREVGDRLLQTVALRLNDMFAEEKATVARFDGDEFGVLIEHQASTPAGTVMAMRINDELAEPVFVGDQGVAATATIAVLHDPKPDATPEELLRATDITLRRLKAGGRRQWGMVDEQQNASDRDRLSLASTMPGAWESGEIELEYQPLVSIPERNVVAVQALLRWNHADGSLDHERCLQALAETGLALPIGRWMLSRACEELKSLPGRPVLYVELPKELAGDQDLVATVQAVLSDAGLAPKDLRLGMPVQALCLPDGMAEDNLEVLVDLGHSVVLYEFGTTSGDLACLEDLPIHTVKMSTRVVSRIANRSSDETLFTRTIRDLVPLVRGDGTPVIVGDIDTKDQFDWWTEVGVDTILGGYTGTPGPASALS
jgi:diguanylate cyclase (GGDEF)-like protein/PAS domain S-box-containing protein